MSRRLTLAAGATLLAMSAFPWLGNAPAHAGTGCTITPATPGLTCMYACVQGEYQRVTVTGNDVGGQADCGYAAASCYSTPTSTGCSDSSNNSATFTDTYWRACSASPGSLATVWLVTCASA